MGDTVVCIKEYGKLRVGSHYKINGCGDLTWNSATDLDGYGFCIQYEEISNWKLSHKDRVTYYYFREEDMSEYFVDVETNYKVCSRENKLKTILNDRYF